MIMVRLNMLCLKKKVKRKTNHRLDTLLLANAQLDAIANNAMNPITSQAISNQSNVKNESNVSIGEIKVETQATDAQGMVSGVKDALQDQLADFNQQNSTG